MQEDDEIIREFLIESNENLNRLDAEIVDLERHPTADRLASIFRTIHTIKGTCGFLGFSILESITHHAENILSQLRSGQRQVTGSLVSLILESVDAVRRILSNIEASSQEGSDTYPELVERLERVAANASGAEGALEPITAVGSAPVESSLIVAAESVPAAPLAPAVGSAPAAILAAAAAVAAPAEQERGGSVAESSIRVDVSLLDKLMNLVGELVLARNQILQFTNQRDDAPLTATSQRLNQITSELQESVMKTRMQPIGVIWNKLPRVVRDVAHALGKQMDLEMEGAETELDKTIIEAIKDPLTHVVRNACDHGIEDPETRLRRGKPSKGTLRLKAYHEGGQVIIEITDNGAGVNIERVKLKAIEKGLIRAEQAAGMSERDAVGLLFLPGFSTASTITNVSGRGVGMDVVKSNVEKIGGTVDIVSRSGEGTTVKLKIPLTLAIIPGLLVTSGGHRFVIPQISLLELIRLEGEVLSRLEFVHETPVFRRRGALLPIAHLSEVLKLPAKPAGQAQNLVVLQAEERQFGLVVDGVNDTQEIVVKPLGKQLKGLTWYAGSTIMGDGAVALILDIVGIGHLSGVLNPSRPTASHDMPASSGEQHKQRLLLFRSGSFKRLAVPLSLVARLEEIPVRAIEKAGGRSVVQYRGQILPLIPLTSLLEPSLSKPDAQDSSGDEPAETLQVVVFSSEDRTIGLIVDRILDIVDEAISMRRPSSPSPGILGSAVVGKKVADFLDLQAVVEMTGERFFGRPEAKGASTILLADNSAFKRGLLRSQLEMNGYDVVEAGTLAEASQQLETGSAQLLVVSSELTTSDPPAFEKLRRGVLHLPVLAVGSTAADMQSCQALGLAIDDYQLRFERESMLKSIARLAQMAASSASPGGSGAQETGGPSQEQKSREQERLIHV